MKRKTIRIFGACLGGILSVVPRVWAVTENVSGKTGQALYQGTATYNAYSGFAYYGGNAIGCIVNDNDEVTGCNFDTAVCDDHYSAPSGTGSGGGTFVSGEDSMRCIWYKCLASGGYEVQNCGGESYCNMTGVYCQFSGIFSNYGTSYTGATWNGKYTSASLKFIGCDSGWYKTLNTGAPCDGAYTGSYSGMNACCEPCPGLKDFNAKTASGTTYTHGTDSNSANGYSWNAPTGVGITSCVAYPPNTTYNDDYGTYDLSSGCPYK